jgi:transcription elongation factor Elf1
MLRYASARSRCPVCQNSTFVFATDHVQMAGREYAIMSCRRCGGSTLVDVAILVDRSKGAPVHTAW